MDVRVGLWRKLSALELMLLNCGVESPLDCNEIQAVHSKGDQSSVFIGRTDAKAETPILWPPHAKSWLVGKDPDAQRDGGQEEKVTTVDEISGCITDSMDMSLSQLQELVMDQGGLACCDSWGRKESDTTEQLNWIEVNWIMLLAYENIHRYASTPPWLPPLLTFFTGFLLHWRNKRGQPGSLYSSPCFGLTLHQPSPGVLSSVPSMLSAPQTHLAPSCPKAFAHSVFFDYRSLPRPTTMMGNSLLRHLQR